MPSSATISKLQREIKILDKEWANLNKKGLAELLRIIRRKGWTTPAELKFVQGILQSLIVQTRNMNQLTNTLIGGSRSVGLK